MNSLAELLELLSSGRPQTRRSTASTVPDPFKQCVADRAAHTEDVYNFEEAGICYFVKNVYRFNWNGYVRIPEDHPDRELNVRQMNALYSVHNGITYCRNGIIGFTTADYNNNNNDYCLLRESTTGEPETNCRYRSFDFVRSETQKLAQQVARRYCRYHEKPVQVPNFYLYMSEVPGGCQRQQSCCHQPSFGFVPVQPPNTPTSEAVFNLFGATTGQNPNCANNNKSCNTNCEQPKEPVADDGLRACHDAINGLYDMMERLGFVRVQDSCSGKECANTGEECCAVGQKCCTQPAQPKTNANEKLCDDLLKLMEDCMFEVQGMPQESPKESQQESPQESPQGTESRNDVSDDIPDLVQSRSEYGWSTESDYGDSDDLEKEETKTPETNRVCPTKENPLPAGIRIETEEEYS